MKEYLMKEHQSLPRGVAGALRPIDKTTTPIWAFQLKSLRPAFQRHLFDTYTSSSKIGRLGINRPRPLVPFSDQITPQPNTELRSCPLTGPRLPLAVSNRSFTAAMDPTLGDKWAADVEVLGESPSTSTGNLEQPFWTRKRKWMAAITAGVAAAIAVAVPTAVVLSRGTSEPMVEPTSSTFSTLPGTITTPASGPTVIPLNMDIPS
jgi:hypothetical protein